MNQQVVGIFSFLWNKEYGQTQRPSRNLLEKYRRVVWHKANPRHEDYMKNCFFEHWPDGIFVNADTDSGWYHNLSEADTIVLLYPDAIGLGFAQIESRVAQAKKKWAAVRVLNGRKRSFLLTPFVRAQLVTRRFLERSMLGEIIFTALFIVITPLFVMIDRVKGRQ